MNKKETHTSVRQAIVVRASTLLLGVMTLLLVFGSSESRAQMPGYKYQAKITPEGKAFVVVTQPDAQATYVGVIGNGNVIEVLQKKDDWLEVLLSFGRKGWVQYLPTGPDWQWELISLGMVAKPEAASIPTPVAEQQKPSASFPTREQPPEQRENAYEDLLRRVLALEKRVLILERKRSVRRLLLPPLRSLCLQNLRSKRWKRQCILISSAKCRSVGLAISWAAKMRKWISSR